MFSDKYSAVLCEYEKFWERKNTKRPILNISYGKENALPFREPQNPTEKWLDLGYKYNRYKHILATTGYIAEGIPMQFTNFGPGCLSACIGGSFEPAMNTVWFDTDLIVKEWETPPAIRFDEQSEMWQYIIAEQKIYAADPDVHFSITDIGGIMDVVAALRGTENLLYDLYDYPDEVKEFTQRVKEEWFKVYDRQLKIVSAASQPYNNWMNIPSSLPWYPLQCDFCYMISPKQFREFVLDDIVDQVNYMPRSIYHLDGVGELPHLDMLLDIQGLTGIQWVPGAGNAMLWDEQWFDLYRRIQDKKKNIVLLGGISEHDEAGAERLIKSLDPTGVYISFCCSSEDKAKDLFEKISRWSE